MRGRGRRWRRGRFHIGRCSRSRILGSMTNDGLLIVGTQGREIAKTQRRRDMRFIIRISLRLCVSAVNWIIDDKESKIYEGGGESGEPCSKRFSCALWRGSGGFRAGEGRVMGWGFVCVAR